MATTTSSFKKWIKVPSDSTFILTTKADPPDLNIDVEVSVDGQPDQSWSTSQLLNKTKKLKLKSPKRYQFAVTIVFVNKTTLTVDARIEKPDGSLHGKPFNFTATKPPTAHHADISAITLKA